MELMVVIGVLFAIGLFISWWIVQILAWIHIYSNERIETATKVIYALAVFFLPIVGSVVYFLLNWNSEKRPELIAG